MPRSKINESRRKQYISEHETRRGEFAPISRTIDNEWFIAGPRFDTDKAVEFWISLWAFEDDEFRIGHLDDDDCVFEYKRGNWWIDETERATVSQ